ncbi:methionine synthase [Paramagnetospirillum kuznetsovii]|uniref:Methionine synthase n=1 Tax=Paramagnetospirillum kuznetsovii TaxID=2053833 RepID=A0A364P104_9PROT|nr:methionine synthase [Paramagnetospirillum kuznetsovii]RAU22837.1 methionine synthase [Paramagnetospirillum kuznetsovii]
MTNILDHLHNRVLLCDGGTGALVQAMNLSVDKDFMGLENCTEILVKSRPDVIRGIHERYFEAGADMVEADTFGASPITLAEFGIADQADELNRLAIELAWEATERFKGDGRARFVLGAIGPGTKLPTLGHIGYDELEAAYVIQAAGQIKGNVSAFLVETCQDPLQIKAAVNGCKIACANAGKDIPIFVQVTVETTGTLLVGADIAAAATVVHSLDVPLMGLNCAAGPQEMGEHFKWLVDNWDGFVSIQPNAGLPELVDGKTRYPLLPDELAVWHERFVAAGANLLGGCCGTTPPHISATNEMLKRIGNGYRPTPVKRSVHWVPAVASLYSQVPLKQENAFLAIGERCNANGSKKFRDLQDAEDWDGITAMAREQVKEGSHTLDVCTAFVGRDEVRDMTEVVSRLRGAVTTPLVIDSTELPVLEAGLKLYGGKAILNSINFENGEKDAADRLTLARKFGAAVVALTIDEDGMAKDVEAKMRIAHRLYDFAVNQHGLPASDLLFDPLTFTICTGNEDDRKLAVETLDSIKRIARELPDCGIVLGLSNVSFGLKAAARQILNSVFLHHAMQAGMTGAIVHVSKILALHTLPPEEVQAAEDLIFDHDPQALARFIALFGDRKAAEVKAALPAKTEDRLKQRIIDGDRTGLDDDLAAAMAEGWKPLDIINNLLLDGMKVVGELFGSGKMQLPFVLQSAETMKAAVAWLEPHMEKADGQQKATLVLATVKGDVHDIGKNLVDIILTNNGYKVVNIGIKQPVAEIIKAAKEHKADAVGMSGLLVKSTVIMRENLEEMTAAGLDIPVLLGGAALTRKYVEEDCRAAYGSGRVAYARDAFDGLDLMAKVAEGKFDAHVDARAADPHRPGSPSRKLGEAAQLSLRPVDWDEINLRRAELHKDVPVPVPPFWGAKVIESTYLQNLIPFLNETMLYQFHWGYRKQGRSLAEFKDWAHKELKPIALDMLKRCAKEEILRPQAAYGYWKAASDGDSVVLFHEDGKTEAARFPFPRQAKEGGLCIADFFRPVSDPVRDVIGLQVVTMGKRATEVASDWFKADKYQDYLYLHGLSVEMAEAMAEYVHKRIRSELGFAAEDAADMDKLLKQQYRGSRFSFGYPACPRIEDQTALLSLLGADRIGVTLSDEFQLEPEQSTSAIVTIHPQAKYFSV